MNRLNLSLFSRLNLACVCISQGVMISVLGLPALADSLDSENTRHQSPIAILESDGETLPPFPLTESAAALLLPKELTQTTANNTENSNPLLTQVTAENTEDTPAFESDNSDHKTAADNPWTFKFQPYATLALSTYGSSTVRGRTIDYDLNLAELLDILKVAASGRFEAWHHNLGFIFDGYYVNLGGGGIVSFQSLPNTTIESKLTLQQGIYDFAISYRFGDTPPNRLPEKPSDINYPLIWFEPMAGVRLNDINAELTEFTIKVGDTSVSTSLDRIDKDQGRTWFEPLLGGKLGVQLSDPIALWLRGDVSGFGLAGDTDLSWQVLGGIDWWANHSIALQLGYRFYEIDYQNGSGKGAFGMNLNLNGPFVGATFYF